MQELTLTKRAESDLQVMCLGAHSDDIEIGCGGTILRLINEYPSLIVTWIVFGSNGDRTIEAKQSAEAFLCQSKHKSIIVKEFRDGYFPYIGAQIKDYFEELKKEFTPDLIFTHYRNDLHQDHRLLCELTWNTFRNHLILEYEIPKYDGDVGAPNFFVPLDNEVCNRKIENIMEYFKTQENRHWFTADTFWSMMRLRGMECGSKSKFAEAFYCRKLVI